MTFRTTPAAAIAALALAAATVLAGPTAASAAPTAAPLTNLSHLDFLLDQATPPEQAGHTTFRLDEEPTLTLPWTYADARDGGTFERVGGGPLDPVTGDWGQGAYNADDVSRAAVVYLRHWQQTGDDTSRDRAYELLRALAYFQTVDGPNAGNVVLWMQTDGELNASAEPVELPDPSDSDESYWLARTIWAYGEGYAAFTGERADAGSDSEDVAFAGFLRDRMELSLAAANRGSLGEYGTWDVSDGVRVPGWLIADGADISGEAVLGLAAYVTAASATGTDADAARTALAHLAEGVAAMSSGSSRSWPYGAILPWTHSTSMWHAWSSQMPAALAAASVALGDPKLLTPAVADAAVFSPTLLTAGGPDNAWYPTPVEKTQIAYGADSRLQSLLAVGDAANSDGIRRLAGIEASWYFGSNVSGEPVYDPATGVTYDGVAADGTINRNSGAESTIHGLLSMLALDAHPEVAARATGVADVVSRDGLRVVEAETAVAAGTTTGSLLAPESAWTGESQYGAVPGGAADALVLDRGEKATFALGSATGARWVEPVLWLDPTARSTSLWTAGSLPIGALSARAGAQGVSESPGVLRPLALTIPVPAGRDSVGVRALSGSSTIDALIVRPVVSRLEFSGAGGATQLLQSSALLTRQVSVGWAGARATVTITKADGSTRSTTTLSGIRSITLKPGDFAVVTR